MLLVPLTFLQCLDAGQVRAVPRREWRLIRGRIVRLLNEVLLCLLKVAVEPN